MKVFCEENPNPEEFAWCSGCDCYYNHEDNNIHGYDMCYSCGESTFENFEDATFDNVLEELKNIFIIAEMTNTRVLPSKI